MVLSMKSRLLILATSTVLLMSVLITGVGADLIHDACSAFNRKDYTEALRLYKSLANQGNSCAQNNLGIIYGGGLGVPVNHSEAAYWYRKAAVQGNAAAQANLGLLYEKGHGVPKNQAKAAFWYRKAANQGLSTVQYFLGVMYVEGRGVKKDYIKALKWLNLSIVAGVPEASETRNHVLERLTSDQVSEANRLSRGWKPKREE